MFSGLIHMHKLKLDRNLIHTIEKGALKHLKGNLGHVMQKAPYMPQSLSYQKKDGQKVTAHILLLV